MFAGGAVLTSVAKHFGLGGIAIDKTKRPNARCSIFQLDVLKPEDRELLEDWLQSALLLWVHLAPVCGTASKVRERPRADVPFAPSPLRSCDFPHGLPSLSLVELNSKGWSWQTSCSATRVTFFLCVYSVVSWLQWKTQEVLSFG